MPRELKTLPELAYEFMRWEMLPVDERDPRSQTEWCEVHEVPHNTPARWRRSAAWTDALEDTQRELNLDEGNIQQVVTKLRDQAMRGDVQAMKAYMQYATSFESPDDEHVRGMSDEELADALLDASHEVRARASA